MLYVANVLSTCCNHKIN